MNSAKRRQRRRWWWLVLLLVLGGGGYGYSVYSQRELPVVIQVEKAVRRNLVELVVANGRVQPVTQVKISPEVSGEIIELPVKEGQSVKKGDLLLRIRPDTYQASRRSAQASFMAAQAAKTQAAASQEKARIEFERNQKLFGEKLIAENTFQEYRTALEVAGAALEASTYQVEVAKASLARAEEDLAKTTIYSPLQGTISRLNSQLGERVVGTAMMTGTEVMTVADLTEMEARVDVGEMDVVIMKLGLKVRLEVDAFRDRKFNGRVTEVANSSRAAGLGAAAASSQDATRFEVKVRIEEKESFRPGMSVTAEIETRYRTNALCIPIQSVTTRILSNAPTGRVVAEAKPDSGGAPAGVAGDRKGAPAIKPLEVVFLHEAGTVRAQPVKRGVSDDTHTEILEGIAESQEVVSGPYRAISRDLKAGSRVKVGVPGTDPGAPKPQGSSGS